MRRWCWEGWGDDVVNVSAHGGAFEEYAGLCRRCACLPTDSADAVEGAVQEGLDFGGEGMEHAPNSGAVVENG